MSGGVAAFVGPPLIAVYRAQHNGAWPDIRSEPALAGQKATDPPGDRYERPEPERAKEPDDDDDENRR
ncbi:MAG: hypothetical protein OXG35_21445 [Acidobacteria bacterium]|nr:hypothetical protein [Acidobacteriota bacterium]